MVIKLKPKYIEPWIAQQVNSPLEKPSISPFVWSGSALLLSLFLIYLAWTLFQPPPLSSLLFFFPTFVLHTIRASTYTYIDRKKRGSWLSVICYKNIYWKRGFFLVFSVFFVRRVRDRLRDQHGTRDGWHRGAKWGRTRSLNHLQESN
jgi:hypothetical protein